MNKLIFTYCVFLGLSYYVDFISIAKGSLYHNSITILK